MPDERFGILVPRVSPGADVSGELFDVSVRGPLKDTARNLIREYEGVLANPFFADVDQSNGFGSFAITSAARSALADITAVLA